MATIPKQVKGIQPDSEPATSPRPVTAREAALAYCAAGYSVIPVRADGSKEPDLKTWKRYQQNGASADTVSAWFPPGHVNRGPALVCGKVSGGLCNLDFDRDDREMLDRWQDMVEGSCPGLTDRLALIKSPAGYHAWGRCPDAKSLRREVVALDRDERGALHCMIEFRGEGSYTLAPGCPASCHRSGRLYLPFAGRPLTELEPIAPAELEVMLAAARSFDQCQYQNRPRARGHAARLPGEDYDRNGPPWSQILLPHGWEMVGYADNGEQLWRRPGKDEGHSASTGYCRGKDATDLLRVFSTNAAPFERDQSYGKFRAYALLNHGGDLAAAARSLRAVGYGKGAPAPPAPPAVLLRQADSGKPPGEPADDRPAGDRLIAYALGAPATLFPDLSGTGHVKYRDRGALEIEPAEGPAFRDWLRQIFRDREGGREATTAAVELAVAGLASRARRQLPRREVFLRVDGSGPGRALLDLADASRRIVELTAAGWTVGPRDDAFFVRPAGLMALPEPAGGGCVDDLWMWLNVGDADDRLLLLGWTVHALLGRAPFPLLVLSGQQGSAKSTTARLLRSLLDPHFAPLASLPDDPRDLAVQAQCQYVLAFDNLSSLKVEMADALCRMSTGGGFVKRALHTNAELVMLDAKRPVILTSIADVATRGDLLDRAVLVELAPIASGRRRTEDDLWREWERECPAMLGALLDLAARALAIRPGLQLQGLPRMADFALTGCAVARALGKSDLAFLRAYQGNLDVGASVARDADIITEPLMRLLPKEGGEWQGSATELLAALAQHAPPPITSSARWPKTAHHLAGAIRRQAPALAAIGIIVDSDRTNRARTIRLTRRPAGPPGEEM